MTQRTYTHPQQEQTQPEFAHSHHLRPTSHRSHRSTSAGSISSAYSNFTQWGSESDYTEAGQQNQPVHIDPKLFQPKERSEDEAVEEAPPPAKKKSRKAKAVADKEDRKRVSHARKVSLLGSFPYMTYRG